MHKPQQQVKEFMLKMGQTRRDTPGFPDADTRLLRFRLIHEEAGELCTALMKGDLVQSIDGICDLLYVVYGAAEALGVDLEAYFEEVHRSNMDKDPNVKDEFGKVIKPFGWTPPRIKEMLAQQLAIGKLKGDDNIWPE